MMATSCYTHTTSHITRNVNVSHAGKCIYFRRSQACCFTPCFQFLCLHKVVNSWLKLHV